MPESLPAAPAWLHPITLHAMEAARDRAQAWGKDAFGVAEAAREVVLAHYPAIPLPMIAEAVAAIVHDPQGYSATAGQPAGVTVAYLFPLSFIPLLYLL